MRDSIFCKFNFLKKNRSNNFCSFINGGLIFTENSKISLCKRNFDEFTIISEFNGLWVDVEKIKKSIGINRSSVLPNCCDNCCYLSSPKKNIHYGLEFVVFSHWKSCFLNCVYCCEKKTDDLLSVEHFDISPVIQQLIDSNLITRETLIVFECGDAVLHPEFEKILYFLMNFGIKNVEIHTSALRYCQAVSDAIAEGIAKVVISIDSGCPYIYEQVKGTNKFDLMFDTVKRYIQIQDKTAKSVISNYTLVQGLNDNKKEIIDWFMLCRNMGFKKLSVDIDDRWYNSLEIVPTHLKEIILFVKELSELNKFEIEFSPKMKQLSEK